MTEIKHYKTIAFRWMTMQSIAFVLVLAVTGVFQYMAIKKDLYKEVELTGRLTGQLFREFFAEHRHAFEEDTLAPLLLRVESKLGHIEDVEIIDSSGRIIADSDLDETGNIVTEREITRLLEEYGEYLFIYKKNGNNHLHVAMSLEGPYDTARRSNIIGVINFDLDLRKADATLRRNFAYSMLLMTLLLAVLWVAGYITISKLFINRLGSITKASYRFGSGDYSERARVYGDDEIAVLASTFNSMADMIQKSRDELLLAGEQLKATNAELKDFAYVVSHDLKAPLRAISSLAGWLAADYADKFDETGKEHLHLLVNRTRRMHNLIEGILNYSRAGRLTEEKTAVDLNKLAGDVLDLISPPEHVKVRIGENDVHRLPTILCEQTKMEQVFQNLISNAIKYMDKPQGLIDVGCHDAGEFWEFYVKDNGPGIEEKHFEKIFQLFQTLRPKDEFESTGVGLAVVKKIIEGMGGKIWVESTPGEGTTFRFTVKK